MLMVILIVLPSDSFKVFGSDNSKVIFVKPMIGNHSMNQTNLQLLS